MDEEERRRKSIENLDAMHNPMKNLQLLEDMIEDSRLERSNYFIDGEYDTPCGYNPVNFSSRRCLTVPEIWKDIASVMRE